MLLTPSHQTALRALRAYRCARGTLPPIRHELPGPDPSPRTRWTRSIIPLDALALTEAPSTPHSAVRAVWVRCMVPPLFPARRRHPAKGRQAPQIDPAFAACGQLYYTPPGAAMQ